MTQKQIDRINNALDWYEGTDGSERENAADEMYAILIDIYNQEISKKKNNEKKKTQNALL